MEKYKFFTANETQPKGWLKKQLEIQASGLSNNLDKVWPDIKESAWIGGKREGWERVPYWLDGFIPLAYLLRDEDMKQRAKNYIDAILIRQKEDGWICPCEDNERSNYDIWAMFLICKVFVVYYECSGDGRMVNAVDRALANLFTMLKENRLKLFNWGKHRWFECFISISWLYDITKQEWLKSLAELLEDEGADYSSFLDKWKRPLNLWSYETHIVNICMALKAEAVSYELLGKKYTDYAETLVRDLDRYNGTAVGLFTGDECLSGLSPIQGTELCAVVEQMFSYETLLAATGSGKWAERLEKLAYNALPATLSEDMWTHQYVQMANQIECTTFPGKPIFRTNGTASHLFGLEPNFGCCTANFSQGWPKFALSTFMRDGATIASAVFAPSKVTTEIGGKCVSIELNTSYPFENTLNYIITADQETKFTFKFRIPSWAKNVFVNGLQVKKAAWYSITKMWSGTQTVMVEFEREVKLVSRPNNLKTVTYGPLVFALPIKGEWEKIEYAKDGVERKFPYCDYQIHRQSDWNYAFVSDRFTVMAGEIGNIPFSEENSPIKLRTKMQKIDWGCEDGYSNVCAKIPQSQKTTADAEEMIMIPYGCTKLRMTEMPKIRNDR